MGAGPKGPDGNADAFAAVAVVTVIVVAVSIWLGSMPA
ncbi:MAG: methionine synthase [Pseudomonadota bacterium]